MIARPPSRLRAFGAAWAMISCTALSAEAADAVTSPSTATVCPAIAGWIEPVSIGGHFVEAKLDTGAATSSLGAEKLEQFDRGGSRWVRFAVGGRSAVGQPADRNAAGRPPKPIEARVVRTVRVKRAGAPSDVRPVVSLPLCLAGVLVETEFTLTSRAGLDYVALVGRSALVGRFVVDPARKHLTTANCPR